MTQKTVTSKFRDSKKKFDAESIKLDLLEDYKNLPKDHLKIINKIQIETLREIPSNVSLVDELIKERKRKKS